MGRLSPPRLRSMIDILLVAVEAADDVKDRSIFYNTCSFSGVDLSGRR